MNPDNTGLPYAYTRNTRAGSLKSILTHLGASAVMAGVSFFELVSIPNWLIALPAIMLFLRCYLYSLLTNSFHEALRLCEADCYLDEIMQAAADAEYEEEAKQGLTPGFFNEKFFRQAPE